MPRQCPGSPAAWGQPAPNSAVVASGWRRRLVSFLPVVAQLGGLELAQHGKYPAAGPAELADILHARLVNPCGPAGQLLSAQLIGQSRED